MYDTLMQMARWYGYHDGYKDILKLWIGSESSEWYQHIYESTEELKSDLEGMESQKLEPKDFGIRVRSHPDTLIITARNKMRSADESKVKPITLIGGMKHFLWMEGELTLKSMNLNLFRRFS